MKKKSIYSCYEEIKKREINELKDRLRSFGGVAHFGPDYTDDGATGTDYPIVMCNLNDFAPHPADVRIMSVGLSSDGRLTINGCEVCNGEERVINLEDIAYGHIEFIIDAIPSVDAEYLHLSNQMRLFCETLVMLSADLFQTINEESPDCTATCEKIVSLAQDFEARLDWKKDDERDYIIELEKFEEEVRSSLKKD